MLERIDCIKAQLPSFFANFLYCSPAKICIIYDVEPFKQFSIA